MPPSTTPPLSPLQPYLIRAWHEWMMDNGLTPFIQVRVDNSVAVPSEFVQDGEIVLNISTEATGSLHLGNEEIRFQTRFSGRVRDIAVPVTHITAIFARENGQGMVFEADDFADDAFISEADDMAEQQKPPQDAAAVKPAAASGLSLVAKTGNTPPPDGDDSNPPDAPKGGSGLRVVK